MKALRSVLIMLLVPLVVSGCASMDGVGTSGFNRCAAGGGLVGGGAAAGASEDAVLGVVGVVVGALAGQIICGGRDSDSDGIPNSKDLCPNTITGGIVNQDGCLDSDEDSIPDTADKCPDTEKDILVDKNGCPPDSDQDGVADHWDECPNTLSGIKVKENGCAKSGEMLAKLKSVNFRFNEASIHQEATTILHKVVQAIKNTETKIRIEGHADNIGSSEYNLALSKRRAEAVRDYLISRGASSSNIVEVIGKGESSPIASNDTEKGRSQNRRVEIIVATD